MVERRGTFHVWPPRVGLNQDVRRFGYNRAKGRRALSLHIFSLVQYPVRDMYVGRILGRGVLLLNNRGLFLLYVSLTSV
jgi:hypothetical protein